MVVFLVTAGGGWGGWGGSWNAWAFRTPWTLWAIWGLVWALWGFVWSDWALRDALGSLVRRVLRGEIGTAETIVGGVAAAVAVGGADDVADG